MADVSRPDLPGILEEVLPDDEREKGKTISSSVQCIGLEITTGSASASKVILTNKKLAGKEKRVLGDLARELLGTPETAITLKKVGRIEIDRRDLGEPLSERSPQTRLLYAEEKIVTLPESPDAPTFRLRAWAFASERPSTHFSPLRLRATFDLLESTVRANFAPPSRSSFTVALRGGALPSALRVLAALHPFLDGLVLWQYDEIDRRYKSLATFGTGKSPFFFDVPIDRTHIASRKGLVSQIMPDRKSVVYDAEDPSLWRPVLEGEWEPFDTDLFKSRKWRSCIAIPIVSAGRLVGALSAYSSRSAAIFDDIEDELASEAAICAEAIFGRRDSEVIADLAARYDHELLTANVSLSALSLSHDVMHYFRSVRKFVEQAQGFLETRRVDEVGKYLKLIKATMSRTKPAIAAMLRLATEARTPERGPQVTSDPEKLMREIEQLLRSILPHFTKSERLKPDAISVVLKGDPRNIKVAELTLERIVVNLCVNAAQWKATNVWVTAHFDRSKSEFQLVVRDDGKGIPLADRDRVFDRFFSGRNGSGLGLYVVKSLASQAGGEVYLQSYHRAEKPSQTGTVVTVVLPTKD